MASPLFSSVFCNVKNFMFHTKLAGIYRIILFLFLVLYLIIGLNTQSILVRLRPPSKFLLQDFGYYERALDDAREGKDPYTVQDIGKGYLYPPPALFVVEAFHYIEPLALKFFLYSIFNIVLLIFIVFRTAKYYGCSNKEIWFWYVLCLGFGPFLELLYLGQINVITLFGIFMMFIWLDTSPILSGLGLSLAIITKVSPILFVGYLLANRKIKISLVVLLFLIVITGLGIVRYGLFPVLKYPEVFQWLSNQFPTDHYNSQSLASKLTLLSPNHFQEMLSNFPNFMRAQLVALITVLSTEHRTIQIALLIYIILTITISGLLTLKFRQPREAMFIVTAFGIMLTPNVMWYHHYVFILLPVIIWMGWKKLDARVVIWCLIGLLIIQFDRFYGTSGLLIHVFCHISLLSILVWQIRRAYFQKIQVIDLP